MEKPLPSSDPWLRVHLQATAPAAMLLGASGLKAPLGCQLLSQGTDVIGLKSTTASDVTDTSVVRFPGIFLHVPSGQDPRLQTWKKINKELLLLSPL